MFGLTYNDNRERGEEGEREKRERETISTIVFEKFYVRQRECEG